MLKDFKDVPLDAKQEDLIKLFRSMINGVHGVYMSQFESSIREQYHNKFDSFVDALVDNKGIEDYCRLRVKEDYKNFDMFLIDFTLYSLILEEVNKDFNKFKENVKSYHQRKVKKLSLEMFEMNLYLSLNMMLSVNLKKIIDNILGLVYTLSLPQEFDNILITRLIDQSILYNKSFSNLYMDRYQGGTVSLYKFDCNLDGFFADPIVISYRIERRKEDYERKY